MLRKKLARGSSLLYLMPWRKISFSTNGNELSCLRCEILGSGMQVLPLFIDMSF
ncbi:hypothetical protein Fmac_031231 [Flemingia macrophylla]|uniref:Uncharacterized protein n=1 Tax=Flemingia macrophylla TaxID=520843 RepID=A0ABD1L1E8_9FABA